MKATEFEYRHQTLIHMAILAAAFATYLFDPDDVVWRFVKHSTAPRELERTAFFVATVLIGVGAAICTRALVTRRRASLFGGAGEITFAIGLASLAPLSGFVILIVGELIRVLRLVTLESEIGVQPRGASSDLNSAFRQQVAKWGIFFTLMVFTFTLKDRIAEALALVSVFVWAMLNLPGLIRSDKAA
jgi:succinate-acetate transporter protein